ncbi:MAG: hypothetical protein ACRDRN_02255 [Sciscionella sp.]
MSDDHIADDKIAIDGAADADKDEQGGIAVPPQVLQGGHDRTLTLLKGVPCGRAAGRDPDV